MALAGPPVCRLAVDRFFALDMVSSLRSLNMALMDPA